MARNTHDLNHLVQELAALTPEERAEVMAQATAASRLRTPPRDFSPPVLSGGTAWIGGSLTREEIYGDDGR